MTARSRPSPTPRRREAVAPDPVGDQSAEATEAARPRGRPIPLIGLLAVLVLAAAVLTGYLATRPVPADVRPIVGDDGRYTSGSMPSADGAAAVGVAVRAVPAALSYDFQALDKAIDEATSYMTPGFAKTFQETFDETAKPMAESKRAVTRALVRGAGLVDIADERASVLVYVNQILVSSDTMKQKSSPAKVSQNRVLVTLERHDDRWLVDDFSPF